MEVVDRGITAAATDPARWAVLVPAALAATLAVARLALWITTATPPAVTPPDPMRRAVADRLACTAEVAVLCDGESLVAVRTSTIAAIATTGDPRRVLLVGSDPRLDRLAGKLGVRRVPSALGSDALVAAALEAAEGTHLALVPASTAVLPTSFARALEGFAGPEGVDPAIAWVQADPLPSVARRPIDHARHVSWWPSLDARGAMPWFGAASIVDVDAVRTASIARGAAAVAVEVQRSGRQGRWFAGPLGADQEDERAVAEASLQRRIDARAARFRCWRRAGSPLVARRRRGWQRLGH
ncbi:MAG: hypothetical protein ACK5CE_02685, partial [Actinomycetes bacterium]